MACWSRVFSGGVSTAGACSVSAGCCNQTEPDQFTTKPTILDELPCSVGSIAEAVGYWVEQLRRRLAGTATIMATSNTVYNITLRRGTRTDNIMWQISTQQGVYPLTVSYESAGDSGTNQQFQNVKHAIDWLVIQLA